MSKIVTINFNTSKKGGEIKKCMGIRVKMKVKMKVPRSSYSPKKGGLKS